MWPTFDPWKRLVSFPVSPSKQEALGRQHLAFRYIKPVSDTSQLCPPKKQNDMGVSLWSPFEAHFAWFEVKKKPLLYSIPIRKRNEQYTKKLFLKKNPPRPPLHPSRSLQLLSYTGGGWSAKSVSTYHFFKMCFKWSCTLLVMLLLTLGLRCNRDITSPLLQLGG